MNQLMSMVGDEWRNLVLVNIIPTADQFAPRHLRHLDTAAYREWLWEAIDSSGLGKAPFLGGIDIGLEHSRNQSRSHWAPHSHLATHSRDPETITQMLKRAIPSSPRIYRPVVCKPLTTTPQLALSYLYKIDFFENSNGWKTKIGPSHPKFSPLIRYLDETGLFGRLFRKGFTQQFRWKQEDHRQI
jgi:hypothetical protein